MPLSSDSRSAPFTLDEFSELVSSAFNLQDDAHSSSPFLEVTPPSPHSLSSLSGDHSSYASCFTHGDPSVPTLDADPTYSSTRDRKARSRTIAALEVFHQVRTRASAFVLRSRASPPHDNSRSRSAARAPFEPLPPLALSPSPSLDPSSYTFSRALSPWSMLDLSRSDRPRSRAESLSRSLLPRIRRDSSPPPLPAHSSRTGSTSGTRTPTPMLRSFFDDSPARSQSAYSRPSTSASTLHPLARITTSSSTHTFSPMDSLPSFFDDTGYQVSRPPAPSHSRPATSSGPLVHTRLPPLRKSRSNGHSLLGRVHRRNESKSANIPTPAGLGYPDLALWANQANDHMPSPLTRPRDPPPIPDSVVLPTLNDLVDTEGPLPPPYVFERRGSATSTSTGSTRSTSSISSRISHIVNLALPSKMRMRGRSKLNLSIAIAPEVPSTDSSPSTLSSQSPPSTPSSPTSSFAHSQSQVCVGSGEGHVGQASSDESHEDVLAIGRVLTPEADPFAKADIAVPITGTPRPPTPPLSHRTSSQLTPSPSILNNHVSWDVAAGKPQRSKKTRNSLPASPVSTAYTFPSSCSIYPVDGSPGYNVDDPFASVGSTPRRQGPPSAWSLFTPPATPLRQAVSNPSTPPTRSPHSLTRSASQQSYRSRPPASLVFPMPPSTVPSSSSRRLERALPVVPPSPDAPPLPPKEQNGIALSNLDSTRRRSSARGLFADSTGECTFRASPDRHEVSNSEVQEASFTLGEGLSGPISHIGVSSRPFTSDGSWRPVTIRRRSVDSASTVTASPGSSALHGTSRDWDVTALASEEDALVYGDRLRLEHVSGLMSSHTTAHSEEGTALWSPITSTSTAFYSAQSDADSESLLSLEPEEEGRTRSLDGEHTSGRSHPWMSGKASSASSCI